MTDHPPYLHNTDPMEVDELPLQVSLLTMELAAQRERLAELTAELDRLAKWQGPTDPELDDG
jgi:hypothetical protein